MTNNVRSLKNSSMTKTFCSDKTRTLPTTQDSLRISVWNLFVQEIVNE